MSFRERVVQRIRDYAGGGDWDGLFEQIIQDHLDGVKIPGFDDYERTVNFVRDHTPVSLRWPFAAREVIMAWDEMAQETTIGGHALETVNFLVDEMEKISATVDHTARIIILCADAWGDDGKAYALEEAEKLRTRLSYLVARYKE